MKPTQEQIEAALAFDAEVATDKQYLLLQKYDADNDAYYAALEILSAAYRELKEAINITITENLHLADGDDCTLKRLKDVIKFKLPEEQ